MSGRVASQIVRLAIELLHRLDRAVRQRKQFGTAFRQAQRIAVALEQLELELLLELADVLAQGRLAHVECPRRLRVVEPLRKFRELDNIVGVQHMHPPPAALICMLIA